MREDDFSGTIRPATEADRDAIRALVHSEKLNPFGLDWRRFQVAWQDGRIVGVAQLRRHGEGIFELGSLVVVPECRGLGVAERLIGVLLTGETGRIYVITPRSKAPRYERHGFRPVAVSAAPAPVRVNWFMGSLGGTLHSLIMRRRRLSLAVLARPPGPSGAVNYPA